MAKESKKRKIDRNNINQLPHNCYCPLSLSLPLSPVSTRFCRLSSTLKKAIICNAQLSLHDFYSSRFFAVFYCAAMRQNTKKGETERRKKKQYKKSHPKISTQISFFFVNLILWQLQSWSRSASHVTQSRFVLFLMPNCKRHDRYLCNFRSDAFVNNLKPIIILTLFQRLDENVFFVNDFGWVLLTQGEWEAKIVRVLHDFGIETEAKKSQSKKNWGLYWNFWQA